MQIFNIQLPLEVKIITIFWTILKEEYMLFACTFSEIKDFFLSLFLSLEVTGHISIKT